MNKERLLKLVEALESGKLHVKTFDITTIYNKKEDCGCAISEIPHLWPESWEVVWHPAIEADCVVRRDTLPDRVVGATRYHVMDWFGLEQDEWFALFCAEFQGLLDPYIVLKPLTADTTPLEMAQNMRTFIKYKEDGSD